MVLLLRPRSSVVGGVEVDVLCQVPFVAKVAHVKRHRRSFFSVWQRLHMLLHLNILNRVVELGVRSDLPPVLACQLLARSVAHQVGVAQCRVLRRANG